MHELIEALRDFCLTVFSIIFPVITVFILVILGWYLVWKLFLSRFRFVRELIGSMGESPVHTANDPKQNKPKVRRD